jgi:hypothetical protein
MPVRGRPLAALRKYVNVAGDADWYLLAAWLVSALRPCGPYPVLCLQGEQGSAKSTVARMLRSLIDPNAAGLRSEPRDVRDVMIAAVNGWVVALDNLSHIPVWLSDCLCRLATGGGYATRELYSDSEEVILDAQRPVILTSIEDLATLGGLLDRALVLTLLPIEEDRRRCESAVWEEFDRARPQLLGAVLDALTSALARLPSVSLDRMPRMADFARLGVAVGQALGWEEGEFLNAYARNRQTANSIALEASPVVSPLLNLVLEKRTWTGTAGELLQELAGAAGEALTKSREWPGGPRALSGRLRRLAPNLHAAGVRVSFPERTGRARLIVLTALPNLADDGGDGCDGCDGRSPTCPSKPDEPDSLDPHEVFTEASGGG